MPQPIESSTTGDWASTEKMLFRFFFLFFGLFIFPFPIYYLPHADQMLGWYFDLWNWLIATTGKRVLHLSKDVSPQGNGSGDTTWNYVQMFIILCAAVLGCLTWTLLDRNRKDYRRLMYWFTAVVRFYLAFTLIAYGSFKIFKSQFPYPGIYRLIEPYGESSPMGLAWTFLGYSKAYNYFMGFAEVTGGLLLLFRRTATFGALFSMTVTLNIVFINYCFDVPVKIFSSMLFLMAVYTAAPDIYRLWQFFFHQKESRLKSTGLFFATKWKRVTLLILKTVFIAYLLYTLTSQAIDGMKTYGDDAPKSKFYGYYNVDTFIKNRDTIQPLLTDQIRWNKVVFTEYNGMIVKMMNDSLIYYASQDDAYEHTLTFTRKGDKGLNQTFHYTITNKYQIEFKTNDQIDSLYMKLTKIDLNKFPLTGRGFHWINEYPFNR